MDSAAPVAHRLRARVDFLRERGKTHASWRTVRFERNGWHGL
jgi:hypothetical protein